MPENRTAILIFSRNAHEEFRHKSWGLNFIRFCQVHKTLINKVRDTAAQTGLPVFEADSTIQHGTGFGSRLVSAIDWVRAQGYAQMIIIGNDSPGLTQAHLLKAKTLLENGQSVIGRDSHGGAYLIGLDTEKINKQTIEHIAWQTNLVFEQLQNCLEQVAVLQEVEIDLNTKRDLRLLSGAKTNLKQLIQWIWSLVFGTASQGLMLPVSVNPAYHASFPHRGPPALF